MSTVEMVFHRDEIVGRDNPYLVTVTCDSNASRADRARAIAANVRGRGWKAIGIMTSETYGFLKRTQIVYRIPRVLGCSHCSDASTRTDHETGNELPARDGFLYLTEWDENGPYYILARCYYCNHRDR